MTDGIIQQVFNSYRLSPHNCEYKAKVNDINNLMSRIELELIKKIKQRFPINYDENYSMWHEAIQRILIGGNND